MLRTALAFALALALPFAIGCPPRGGSNGDDDDDGAFGLGGLDLDGDGVLTDADVDSGEGAVYTEQQGGEGDGSTDGETSTDITLQMGDGMWGLSAPFGGDYPGTLTIWFYGPGSGGFELVEGEGSIAWVNVFTPEGADYLLWNESASGTVTITAVAGGEASGYVGGSLAITVADQFEAPIGVTVRVEGIAFRDIPYSLPE